MKICLAERASVKGVTISLCKRNVEKLCIRDARGSIFLLRGGAGRGRRYFFRGGAGQGGAGIKIHGAGRGGAGQGSNPPGAGHFRGRAKRP